MLELRSHDGTPLWQLELADSWLARLKGLIGRRELPPGHGLYLPRTNGVHMFFMRFPIDCVFLGAERSDGTRPVVAIRERLAPWTGIVWWVRGAKAVAELPAGAVSEAGLRAPDLVVLRGLG
jgi:uncharacterized membrane protein (UPF0127 family)